MFKFLACINYVSVVFTACAAPKWRKQWVKRFKWDHQVNVISHSLARALLLSSHCDLDLPLLLDVYEGKKRLVRDKRCLGKVRFLWCLLYRKTEQKEVVKETIIETTSFEWKSFASVHLKDLVELKTTSKNVENKSTLQHLSNLHAGFWLVSALTVWTI